MSDKSKTHRPPMALSRCAGLASSLMLHAVTQAYPPLHRESVLGSYTGGGSAVAMPAVGPLAAHREKRLCAGVSDGPGQRASFGEHVT
jgi:hypothetical protein